MTENLAAFMADFGVAATLPNTSVVRGIFDATPKNALGVIGPDPQFVAATADLSGLAYGNDILINGATYTVRAIEADGTGMTTLSLEAA